MKKLLLLLSMLFIIPALNATPKPIDGIHTPTWLLQEKPEFTRSEILQLPVQLKLFSQATETKLESATLAFLVQDNQ